MKSGLLARIPAGIAAGLPQRGWKRLAPRPGPGHSYRNHLFCALANSNVRRPLPAALDCT
jgi:hypothetical protein